MPPIQLPFIHPFVRQIAAAFNQPAIAGPPVAPAVANDRDRLNAVLHAVPGQVDPNSTAGQMFAASRNNQVQLAIVAARNNQKALPGQAVALPPAVTVKTRTGQNIVGRWVRFATSSDGRVVGATQRSAVPPRGNDATATAGEWVLGKEGQNTLVAILGSSTVTFTAVAGGTLIEHTATDQQGAPGADAGAPPQVRVRDAANQPINGVTVRFTVVEGGGGLGAAGDDWIEVQTNGGIANSVRWVLGAAGVNRVIATAGIHSVEFRAQVA